MDEEDLTNLIGTPSSNQEDYPLPCDRILPNFPSLTERYFEPRFYVPKLTRKVPVECHIGHQIVLFHSNRIGVVTLAPDHPLLTNDSVIESLDFQVTKQTNRMDNKVSGKWKKGGQRVDQNSQLCIARCEDGSSYAIFACMRGTLIEVNEKLFTDPNILRTKPWSEGYIAIVFPFAKTFKIEKDSLMSWTDYKNFQSQPESKPETEEKGFKEEKDEPEQEEQEEQGEPAEREEREETDKVEKAVDQLV